MVGSRKSVVTSVALGAALALTVSQETITALQGTGNLQQKLEIIRAAKQAGLLTIQGSPDAIIKLAGDSEKSFRDK